MTSIFTPPYTSWTHRLARLAVRPLVGSRITPNDLTTARLVTGVVACGLFMAGDPAWTLWGGLVWIVSCFLDRADGELARLAGTSSAAGHLYDYYCDVAINGLVFAAVGVGLRDGALGSWAIAMGGLAGASVVAASILSERLEKQRRVAAKAYMGILGFDFDDVLYLIGPVAWLGWFPYLLIGAAVGAPVFAGLTWWRLVSAPRVRP